MIKTRSRAIALALSGIFLPGLHKFYLKQRSWGIAYLLLYPTHIPQFASVLEGLWYLWLGPETFEQRFNPAIAHLQANPYAPLRTTDDIQLAERLGLTIDVNRATEQDWQRLPHLSSQHRRLMVRLIEAGVRFNSLEDMAAALGMGTEQLQPFAPVLRFYYYEPILASENSSSGDQGSDKSLEASETRLLNPNQASLAQLTMIPDLDDAIAQQIIQQRQQQPYQDLVDFKQRLSLSAEQIAALMYYLRF